MWEWMQHTIQLDVSRSRGDCTLPKNVKKLYLGKGYSQPHLVMLDPYVGFWGCNDPHPKNKLIIVSGSQTTTPKRPKSRAKGGPPRYTVVKWSEILAPLLMTGSFSSRQIAEPTPKPLQANIALDSLSLQGQSQETP